MNGVLKFKTALVAYQAALQGENNVVRA